MNNKLISFDTDQIMNYVFATTRLKDIRGASTLLDELNRRKMLKIVRQHGGESAEQIYANGGGALFHVPEGAAQAIIDEIQTVYRTRTHSASVSASQVMWTNDNASTEKTQEAWTQLSLHLRLMKDANADHQTVLTHPLLQPCDACGVYYAEHMDSDSDGSQAILCSSCSTKRDKDSEIKREIEDALQQHRKPDRSHLWGRIIDDIQTKCPDYFGEQFLPRANDFNELGSASNPDGYIALIYADGDSLGRTFEAQTSLAGIKKLSEAIDTSMQAAVVEAITRHLKPDQHSNCLPFDILMLGGDDLVMVTTAQHGIETALTIVEQFPHLVKASCGQDAALSAAVVIARASFPIRSLIELTKSALKFAKTQKKKARISEGVINFLVVNSSNHLEFNNYYKEVFTTERNQNGERLVRTMRPYTAHDLHTLLQARRELEGVSTSKLEQLRAAVFKSRYKAIFESRQALLRWRGDKTYRQKIQDLVEVFANSDSLDTFPWAYQAVSNNQADYVTPLADLVELYDFIHVERGNNAN
ncbi:MAG: Cas10/Cmr2 second palm domain-containing protein [Candidatus Promineifilaceae bacterium]